MSVTKKIMAAGNLQSKSRQRRERSEQEGTSLSARIFRESEVGGWVRDTQRKVKKSGLKSSLVEVTQGSTVPFEKIEKVVKKRSESAKFFFFLLLKSE